MHACAMHDPPTPHQIRLLAVRAGVDPRTALKWFRGLAVTSTCAARLEQAAAEIGVRPKRRPSALTTVNHVASSGSAFDATTTKGTK